MLCINKNTAKTTKWLQMKLNLLTLCKSSFKVQFNFHSFEDKGNFANYDKEMIVKIF